MIRNALRIWIIFASLAASTAFAQHFSFGLVAGAGLTDGFQDHIFQGVDTQQHFFSDSKDFIVGPMGEVGFPFGVSVELDALYRPLHLADNAIVVTGPLHSSTTVGTWQFPLLLKYRFPVPVVKPFLEVGPSFRDGSGADASPSSHGITLGGGVEVKIVKVKVAPQLRFTRWGSDAPAKFFGAPQTNVNQAEFLVGLSF